MYYAYLEKYNKEPDSWEDLKDGYIYSIINSYKQNLIQLYASKVSREKK